MIAASLSTIQADLLLIWSTILLSIFFGLVCWWLKIAYSSWRERRQVERRLRLLKVYWPLAEQGRLRRALGTEVMLRRRR